MYVILSLSYLLKWWYWYLVPTLHNADVTGRQYCIPFVTWLLESKHRTLLWHCKPYYHPVISSAPIYTFLKCWIDIILGTHIYILRSFFLCICLSGCVSCGVLQVCKNLWKTQLVLDSLELELQRFVSNHVSARDLLQEQEVLITAGLYLSPLML